MPKTSPTLSFMKRHGIPLTRENFLEAHYLGNPPTDIDPEEEAQFPAPFRTGVRERNVSMNADSMKAKEKHEADKEKALQPGAKKPEPKIRLTNPNPAIGKIPMQMEDITIGGGAKGSDQMSDELRQQQQQFEQKNLKQQNDIASPDIAGPNEANRI